MTVHAVDFVTIDLEVSLRWDAGTALGICADASVETMSWELRVGSNSGEIEASSTNSLTCANTISLRGVTPHMLTAGPHVLVVNGAVAGGATWSSKCSVVLPDGGLATMSCDVARTP